MGLFGIVIVGAFVLSFFPIKDKDSMFGMIVRRSRFIMLGLVAVFIVGFTLLAIYGLSH